MKKIAFAAIGLLVLAWAGISFASMSSASYQIPVDVIGGGGSTMSSASYTTSSTLGQSSPLGTSTSASYVNYPGFWQADECVYDPDADGLANAIEYGYDTDPNNPDSDGDNLNDGEEVTPGSDGYVTDPLLDDTDGDSLGDGDEFIATTNPLNPDTDSDGVGDGDEVSNAMDPLYWDTDGDALPDGFELTNSVGHTVGENLDPIISWDGNTGDFDGDGNANNHEYYNGTSPWDPNPRCGPGCRCWADSGPGEGIMGPGDLTVLEIELSNPGVGDYSGIIPDNGESQELSGEGIMGPGDLTLLEQILKGKDVLGPELGSRPNGITAVDWSAAPVEEGDTAFVTVEVNNTYGGMSPSFGVVFSIDPSSTGQATMLGGDGDSVSGERYDVSGLRALGAQSRIVLRIDQAGSIVINAGLPQCGGGAGGAGRSCASISLAPAATITGIPRP